MFHYIQTSMSAVAAAALPADVKVAVEFAAGMFDALEVPSSLSFGPSSLSKPC